MPKRKAWSKIIEEHGVRVRLFERTAGGVLYREVRGIAGKADGKDRRSLGHRDRTRAENEAKALCEALATARLTGRVPGTLTLAELRRVYELERGPQLSDLRKIEVARAFRLLEQHLGPTFRIVDLGPHQLDTYTTARREGTLVADWGRNGGGKVGAAAVARELGVLHAALNWAEHFRQNGRPLIEKNPIRGIPVPREKNPRRPRASRERYEKLVAVADSLDSTGALRTMLHLAWFTGRRLGSIVALRASDILLTPEQIRGAVAAAGREDDLVEKWPAAIMWSAEADKEGVEWLVPIPESLGKILGDYVRARALVGGALLFPARKDPGKPLSKETAYYWMREAEKRAGLPKVKQGGWHAFRRAWATSRKHLPLVDIMAAGGWRDPAALQRAYLHADADTIRAVMNAE